MARRWPSWCAWTLGARNIAHRTAPRTAADLKMSWRVLVGMASSPIATACPAPLPTNARILYRQLSERLGHPGYRRPAVAGWKSNKGYPGGGSTTGAEQGYFQPAGTQTGKQRGPSKPSQPSQPAATLRPLLTLQIQHLSAAEPARSCLGSGLAANRSALQLTGTQELRYARRGFLSGILFSTRSIIYKSEKDKLQIYCLSEDSSCVSNSRHP